MLCYAKSLQLCPTLCDPIDGSPPGFPVPGILQARTPEWVAISFSNAWKWKEKVKNLPAIQETRVQWLGWEDPLEKGMTTHSSILAWEISRTEEPGREQSMGSQRVRHNSATNAFSSHKNWTIDSCNSMNEPQRCWKKRFTQKTASWIIPFIWSSRTGKTNLWLCSGISLLEQWLPLAKGN